MNKKLTVKDYIQAIAAGFGIVGGLCALVIILLVLFEDYDPRTTLQGIEREWKMLFS